MDNLIDYICGNKEWLFSGIGVVVVTVVLRAIFPSKPQLIVHKHIKKSKDKPAPKERPIEKLPPLDNRVTFSDGKFAEVEVNGVVQLYDPMKYLDNTNTFDILRRATDVHLRQTLEGISIVEARTRRQEIGKDLVEKLQGIYREHGFTLKAINIGNIKEITNSFVPEEVKINIDTESNT